MLSVDFQIPKAHFAYKIRFYSDTTVVIMRWRQTAVFIQKL